MSLKLYTVVRHELPPRAKAAQSAHALAALALEHPVRFEMWGNGTIVLLEDTPRLPLSKIIQSAEDGRFRHSVFHEPDRHSVGEDFYIKNSRTFPHTVLTAAAFVPDWLVQNVLLADLPTTLRTESEPLHLLESNRHSAKKGWFWG